MLKKFALALMPLTLLVSNAKADDLDLNIDVAAISDADIEIVEAGLDIDPDALNSDSEAAAGDNELNDAIEACFRRFGCGYGYGCGYNCYNHCGYRSYYSYRPICYAPPVYRCVYAAAPVYHYYWGCY